MTGSSGGYHDVGGLDVLGAVDTQDKPLRQWELQIHCLVGKIASKGCLKVDEVRLTRQIASPGLI